MRAASSQKRADLEQALSKSDPQRFGVGLVNMIAAASAILSVFKEIREAVAAHSAENDDVTISAHQSPGLRPNSAVL